MRTADRELAHARTRRGWMLTAGFLISLTFQKLLLRDARSVSVGLQGVLETGLIVLAFLIVILQSREVRTRIGVHPCIWCFAAYGLFSLASSVNSFDMKMSVVKGVLFFFMLMIAYLACEMQMSMAILDGVYRGYIATLLAAVAVGIASPDKHPLFVVESSFNGRTRLALLSTHPNAIAEVTGLLFLLALILPIRTRWYWQAFLLIINVLAAERTATAALVLTTCLVLLFGRPATARRREAGFLAGICACAGIICIGAGLVPGRLVSGAGLAAESIYGTKVASEVKSLDGRADVWRKGLELAQGHIVLGYGFEGARDALISGVAYWTGNAHNGILQSTLSAGLIGTLALLLGWFLAVKDALSGERTWKVKVLGLNLYLLCLTMVSPIFDSYSNFVILLFVTVLYLALEKEIGWSTARLNASLELCANTGFAK